MMVFCYKEGYTCSRIGAGNTATSMIILHLILTSGSLSEGISTSLDKSPSMWSWGLPLTGQILPRTQTFSISFNSLYLRRNGDYAHVLPPHCTDMGLYTGSYHCANQGSKTNQIIINIWSAEKQSKNKQPITISKLSQ